MKALVIGATGIIGNHVTRALLSCGHAVRIYSRGITPSQNLKGLNVERAQGDIQDTDTLIKAMKDCQWVFHAAPYYPTNTFGLKKHLEIAMKGNKSVIEAVKKSGSERLVYTSSLTTIGPPKKFGELADETCSYPRNGRVPHPYFEIKYRMEEEIISLAKKGEIPAVVVNPSGCFGPYELKPVSLAMIPLLIKGRMPAYVDNDINVVDVADVGRGEVLAAQLGRIGERYILGGHNVRVGWVLKKIASIAGVKAPKIKVPLYIALIPAWLSEWTASYVTGGLPFIPILGLRFVEYGEHLSSEKAIKELGYGASPMEPCFEKAISWYREIGYC